MKFEDIWTPKTDGVDDVLAEHINEIADAVIENEKKIKNLEEKEIEITIDTEMSDTSENSVQNKVIKNYVDYAFDEKFDELVNITLSENLATEFRHVFDKPYKKIRFKIVFKGSSNTSLSNVRFKRSKSDGISYAEQNYLVYSSGGNLGTIRRLSGTLIFDCDNSIVLINGANATDGRVVVPGSMFGGYATYSEDEQNFPEFYFYLGGSISDDGTVSGKVLGAGTTFQVWGCEK